MKTEPAHTPADSDQVLAERAISGDASAFNELILRHQRGLFRFLLRNGRCAADAEDALQESLLKAYVNLRRYDRRWRFSTWLYAIALRELRTIKRRRRDGRTSGDASSVAAPEAREHCDAASLWDAARSILPDGQFLALWLRYGESLPSREISQIMRRPGVWVRVSLHRACAAMRKHLEEMPHAQSAAGADGGFI